MHVLNNAWVDDVKWLIVPSPAQTAMCFRPFAIGKGKASKPLLHKNLTSWLMHNRCLALNNSNVILLVLYQFSSSRFFLTL